MAIRSRTGCQQLVSAVELEAEIREGVDKAELSYPYPGYCHRMTGWNVSCRHRCAGEGTGEQPAHAGHDRQFGDKASDGNGISLQMSLRRHSITRRCRQSLTIKPSTSERRYAP
tara:strand:- start:31 stop:372 length:342 start_codon:yes stop_codon:yes gene_type:complete